MVPNGHEEISCVEKIQDLVADLKEKGFDEEILNNAMQLMNKIQNESKELSNITGMGEETEGENSEEEMPDYDSMDKDEMGEHMKKKGLIQITVGIKPPKK